MFYGLHTLQDRNGSVPLWPRDLYRSMVSLECWWQRPVNR